MPSFEIRADIFNCPSVFDSTKGSSNIFNTRKDISLCFQRRHLIICKYYFYILIEEKFLFGLIKPFIKRSSVTKHLTFSFYITPIYGLSLTSNFDAKKVHEMNQSALLIAIF